MRQWGGREAAGAAPTLEGARLCWLHSGHSGGDVALGGGGVTELEPEVPSQLPLPPLC